jgi:hypothetical protein
MGTPALYSSKEGCHMTRIILAAVLALSLAGTALAQSTQVSGQTSPWRISKVIGTPVFNAQDEQIGTIADLYMDQQARVTTAIINVGSYLGGSDRLVAVALETIRFPASTTGSGGNQSRSFPDMAVLAVSKATLQSMPAFNY